MKTADVIIGFISFELLNFFQTQYNFKINITLLRKTYSFFSHKTKYKFKLIFMHILYFIIF